MDSGISSFDANVWLAIAVGGHVHHAAARSWFDGQADGTCAFCRITQLAFLRHLTNPKIMGAANVQSQAAAWRVFESLATDSRVRYLDEPPGVEAACKLFTQHPTPSHKQWTDAFLAAFAMQAGLQIATFDGEFTSLLSLNVKLLTP